MSMGKSSCFLTILFFTGILFQEYSFVEAYSLIDKTKIKFKIFTIIIFLLYAYLGYLNILYNYIYLKPVLSFLLLTTLNIIIFKKNIQKIIIWSLILNIIIGALDLFYAVITFRFLPNIILFDNNYYIKVLYTILISLTTLLIVRIFNIIIRKKKYKNLIDKRVFINLLLLAILINIVVFSYTLNISITQYFINILIIIIALCFVFMNFFQYIKVRKAEDKEIALIKFMTEYEKIIDDNRIIKHEMLNNLLVIKSLIKSKKEKLENTVNQIIKDYDKSSKSYQSGLYNLPTGLKGLVYYKIYDLKKYDVDINIYISKTSIKKMDKMENDIYMNTYKILGILLDNAVEACIESNKKIFILDIYEENNNLCFYIENSTKYIVDITKIKLKGYSTKGKNRGLGLHIIDKILEKNKEFKLDQCINNSGNFETIFCVKDKNSI